MDSWRHCPQDTREGGSPTSILFRNKTISLSGEWVSHYRSMSLVAIISNFTQRVASLYLHKWRLYINILITTQDAMDPLHEHTSHTSYYVCTKKIPKHFQILYLVVAIKWLPNSCFINTNKYMHIYAKNNQVYVR